MHIELGKADPVACWRYSGSVLICGGTKHNWSWRIMMMTMLEKGWMESVITCTVRPLSCSWTVHGTVNCRKLSIQICTLSRSKNTIKGECFVFAIVLLWFAAQGHCFISFFSIRIVSRCFFWEREACWNEGEKETWKSARPQKLIIAFYIDQDDHIPVYWKIVVSYSDILHKEKARCVI